MLSKSEFYNALDNLENLNLSKEEKDVIYNLADIDQDSYIKLEEFFHFMATYEIHGTSSPNESFENA